MTTKLNPYLTQSNEKETMQLVQDAKAKAMYGSIKEQYGKLKAIQHISDTYKVRLSAVRAAAYYW